jgi:large subunit ribosomal protein L3
MKFLLGKKRNMSQVFDETGNVSPVTILETGKLVVTQVIEPGKCGYSAVQVGFGEKKEKNIKKPQRGQFKDLGNFRHIKEFRMPKGEEASYKVGDAIESGVFAEGDTVEVSAVSKGKGFQGVVKRHGFHGGPRSHGQKHSERSPGSIGTAGWQKVIKGMRMAGRMGGDRITVKNLKVVKVDAENKLMYVKGAIPGRRGTLVEIKG